MKYYKSIGMENEPIIWVRVGNGKTVYIGKQSISVYESEMIFDDDCNYISSTKGEFAQAWEATVKQIDKSVRYD